jgi:hypothetical protein
MARNNREFQWVTCCPKCGGRTRWEKLTVLERRESGYSDSMTGYWYCADCAAKDERNPEVRYPIDFLTYTRSNAAVVGLASDTLKRLYKKEPSLDFMIDEGGNLISHPSSMSAWRVSYEARKRIDRQKNSENYSGWLRTDPSSGSIIKR